MTEVPPASGVGPDAGPPPAGPPTVPPADPLARNVPLRRLAVLVLLGTAALLAFFQITNLDIGGHLTVGREILKTGAIPHTDFFSHTVAGAPYPVHQWLGEVIVFGIEHLFGADGLVIMRMLIVVMGAFLLYRSARGQGAPVVVAVAVVLMLLVCARPRFFVRPFLATLVFLPLVMAIVEDVRQGKTRRLWPLLPIMTIWGHLHSGVLFGVLYLGATLVAEGVKILLARRGSASRAGDFPGPVLDGWNYRRLAWFSALAIALPYVTMAAINPSGVKPLVLPLLFWENESHRAMIREYQPVNLLKDWPFDLVAGSLLLGILLRPRRVDLTQLLIAGGFGLMAFQAVRGILPFAIAAAPLLGRLYGRIGEDLFARVAGPRGRPGARLSRANAAEVTTILLFVLAAVLISVRASRDWMFPFGFGKDPKHYPERALDFVWSQNVRGPIFNTDLWASSLLWRGRGVRHPVFVDARLEAYPEDFWRDVYYRVLQAAPGWEEVLARYGVRFAMLRREGGQSDDRIGDALWEHSGWGLAYWDDYVLIYVRREEDGPRRNREVLRVWEFDVFNPRQAREVTALRGEALGRAEIQLARLVEWSPDSFLPRWTLAVARTGLGQGEEAARELAFLAGRPQAKNNAAFTGSRAEAELVAGRREGWAAFLREADRNPDAADELFRGAALLSRSGQAPAAIAMYRDVLAVSPGDADAMNNLALLLAGESPESEEALELLEEALRRVPDDPYVLASRGEVWFGRGDREAALADFQRSLELLSPDDVEARKQVMRWILRTE